MEFKSVAILGAGAVGSYIIWGLSGKKDVDLCILARGERKEKLEAEGLIINGEKYLPKVCTPEEARGVDLLVVTVKYAGLLNSLDDIKAVVGDNTTVISLMNGVDSEEIIGKAVGSEKVVPSLIKVASERVGNEIKFDPETTIGMMYGELDPEAPTDRIDALNALFEGTGLHYKTTDNILREIWSKFLLNIGNNLIQAIINVGVGSYSDSEHMGYLRRKMREEVIAIAAAKGITFPPKNTARLLGSSVTSRARYSTLQDLDAKRHTEIDMFSGAVVRMGEELGIPTPFNDFAYHAIKALEEKNDGLFDYE